MGTSSSGTGPRPTTPLIPTWIPPLDGDFIGGGGQGPGEDIGDREGGQDDEADAISAVDALPQQTTEAIVSPNRYRSPRSKFRTFSRDRNNNQPFLRDSLRQYVRDGSGGSRTLSRRMRPSSTRLARFFMVANAIRTGGVETTLATFQLQAFNDRPVIDVLAALTDIIFDDSSPYHDIQDDSITKIAYANTIARIDGLGVIDLDHLTNDNIELMMAIFIEETIVARVICDIGTKLYADLTDCNEAIAIEDMIYQIVSGYVRNDIMPEIIATQRGVVADLETKMEVIYRIAFDCIAGSD
jgi:hypothetical protein